MLSKIVFIYFIIFVFLFFVPFVICDDCEDNTNPSNRYDCLKLSSSNKLCCYDGNSCKSINDLKDNTNNYDCGIVKGSVGEYEFSIYHPIPSDDIGIGFQTCGAKKPKKKKDFTNYSQLTNSCCYFESKEDNKKKGCYSIGKKYSGPNEEISATINGKNIKYECNGNFLNIILNNFLYFFLFLYLLF